MIYDNTKIIDHCSIEYFFSLIPLNALSKLNFSQSSQYKCIYKENEKILIQGTCTIYFNHNGYFYSIQWPDGFGTGIDRAGKHTVIIDKKKDASLTWDKNVYYFKWENKLMIINRLPVKISIKPLDTLGLYLTSTTLNYSDGDRLTADFRIYCPTSTIRPTNYVLLDGTGTVKKRGKWWEPAFTLRYDSEYELISRVCKN
jgi:hypothetical protein